jgi:hypothetical protein
MTGRRRPLLAIVTGALLLALGAGTAYGLTDALGISTAPSAAPAEHAVAQPATPVVAPPALAAVDAPAGARMDLALGELRSAIAAAPATDGAATLSVHAGDATGTDDTYTLAGTPTALRIDAPTLAGAVRGVYDLAGAARAGRSLTADLGRTVTSRLPFRMVDYGSVGVDADPAQWLPGTDYSLNSQAFADVILPSAPYIDAAGLARAHAQFETYVHHVLAEGATAIDIPGFLEYLDLDGVYAAGDPHLARAQAMRDAFGPWFAEAHDLGLQVLLSTDMLALDTPLETYLTHRFGSLDTEDPALWAVYSGGLDELARTMPDVDGLVIRIGEGGAAYQFAGSDFRSELDVTSVAAARAMLTAFTAAAEHDGKTIVFRTWSVGVGAVGDMHTNPASYHAVLDGIDSPALIVSTKYSLGDFYSHLPLNDTLFTGDQRRIVEFQSRREFEGFGAFPNDLGALTQTALQTFLAKNPHVEGVWVWTQDGGPLRAGPMTLETQAGFWQLYDLDTQLALALARDPEADPAGITADWARRWFSDDPATAAAIGQVMAQSRAAITDGLYIGPYASKKVAALGLHPPTMMWIFEWDILTGDSAALDVIETISRDHLDEAIAEGRDAVARVRSMRAQLAATDASSWKDPALRDELLSSLDYESSTLGMLSDYRTMVLRQAQWHDTLDPAVYAQWRTATAAYERSSAAYEKRWQGDVAHPPYNLTAASLGVARGDLDAPMSWAARAVGLLALAWIAWGLVAELRSRRGRPTPGAAAARAMWIAATRPWRAAEAVAGLGRRDRALLVAVPAVGVVASRGIATWFEAPAHLILVLAAWLVFGLVATLIFRRAAWAALASLGGVAMARVVVLCAGDALSGPGGYWFGFWTDPVARSGYVVVAFALFGWLLVATGWAVSAVIGARRATGIVLGGAGLVLAALGVIVGAVGLEQAVTVWNDQMGLLPWGLSRILGITTYLGIPAETPWAIAIVGAVLLVLGVLLVAIRPAGTKRMRPAPAA